MIDIEHGVTSGEEEMMQGTGLWQGDIEHWNIYIDITPDNITPL